jgi:hypothetical protein
MDKSSSIIMFPLEVLALLKESKRYSGSYFIGCSKTFLTFTNRPLDSAKIKSLSTKSTDCHTSIVSLGSPLSLISNKS